MDLGQTVLRHDPAIPGLRAAARTVEILRPSSDLLARDPGMIAGFESLGRRVILQAFEDAAQGDREARDFLTKTSYPNRRLLTHWIRQAGLTMPLSRFTTEAAVCLENPEWMQTLFARGCSHAVLSPGPEEETA